MIKLTKAELDVAIVASDADATCAFYRDLVGLTELPSMPLGPGSVQRRFRIGKHWVKVNCLAQPPERQRAGIERVGIRLLALIVDDFDRVLGRLDAADHKHAPLAVPAGVGYRVALTQDPEGNVIELIGPSVPGGKELTTRLQIGLTVSNLERSRRFYGELLGLPEQAPLKVGGSVDVRYGFTWGATTVKLWKLPGELAVQTGAPNQHAGVRFFTALVEDLQEAKAELVSKEIPIVTELELPGVARILFFADPDGNWIELAQPMR